MSSSLPSWPKAASKTSTSAAAISATLSNDLLESLESLLKQDDIRRTEKFAALQIAVAVAVEQTLRLVDCSKFHALAEKVGDDLVTLFGDGDVLPRELFRMARHDFNTFTHVTNVASYCVMLAQKLGINDDNELRKIATAAILHDLGKRFIPARILTKTTGSRPRNAKSSNRIRRAATSNCAKRATSILVSS